MFVCIFYPYVYHMELCNEQLAFLHGKKLLAVGFITKVFNQISSYEGHLCFAIWFFSNTFNHSVCFSFSNKPPSACTHLTSLSNQLSMTPDHVDWGMSKMAPSKNAPVSSAFWNCFTFSCLLTEGNKNQSQGAKSGEYGGWVTIWTSLAHRQSRVTAAVCTLALSWWSSRPWTPV